MLDFVEEKNEQTKKKQKIRPDEMVGKMQSREVVVIGYEQLRIDMGNKVRGMGGLVYSV